MSTSLKIFIIVSAFILATALGFSSGIYNGCERALIMATESYFFSDDTVRDVKMNFKILKAMCVNEVWK